ncbi:MAG: hypothetical protein HQK94_09590 [Nitrospirae bacterium]|nr:hypothetical protein [Nitrospirota bacterium]MBF0535417.1 hypothetical protein [Nitrospirota bacterium]
MRHLTTNRFTTDNRGFALYSVVVVTILVMLIFSGLISHGYNVETESVQQSLYRMQAYWAMVGNLEYSLARCRKDRDAEFTMDACYNASSFLNLSVAYNNEITSMWQYDSSGTNLTYNPIVTLANAARAGDVVTLKYTNTSAANSQTPALTFPPLSVGIAIDNSTSWNVVVTAWERK